MIVWIGLTAYVYVSIEASNVEAARDFKFYVTSIGCFCGVMVIDILAFYFDHPLDRGMVTMLAVMVAANVFALIADAAKLTNETLFAKVHSWKGSWAMFAIFLLLWSFA